MQLQSHSSSAAPRTVQESHHQHRGLLLSDQSRANDTRREQALASIHIFEDGEGVQEAYSKSYGLQSSEIGPTTPTLQHIGNEFGSQAVYSDSRREGPYSPTNNQPLQQHSMNNISTNSAYNDKGNTTRNAFAAPHHIYEQHRKVPSRGIDVYKPSLSLETGTQVTSTHQSKQETLAGSRDYADHQQQVEQSRERERERERQREAQRSTGLVKCQSAGYNGTNMAFPSRDACGIQKNQTEAALILSSSTANAKKAAMVAPQLQDQSMTSFVPQGHIMSTSCGDRTMLMPQSRTGRYSSSAHRPSEETPLQSQSLFGAGDSRKKNLNKLDQNFNELMEQNQKLEREIRTMNDQFTIRQNERLAKMARDNISGQQEPIMAKMETNLPRSRIHGAGDGSLVMGNMESSFDVRCHNTKQIVSQLAQRLSAVKRETSNELDKIKMRHSARQGAGSIPLSTSNSNSRSPNPATYMIKPRNESGSQDYGRYEQESSSQAAASNMINLQRVTANAQEAKKHSMHFDASGKGRNGSNTTQNLADAIGDLSVIPSTHSNTNNVSYVSAAGGFNFRQLKPTESIHASLNDLPELAGHSPHESVIAKGDVLINDQQLCKQAEQLNFDNSPVRQTETQGAHKAKIDQPQAAQEVKQVDPSALNGGDFDQSLMQMIPNGAGSLPTSCVISTGDATATLNLKNMTAQVQQRLVEAASNPRLASQITPITQPTQEGEVSEQQQTISVVGPDRSPLNINGAQLSNILSQINNPPANGARNASNLAETQVCQTNLPLQAAGQQHLQAITISPSNGVGAQGILGQNYPSFFLSQDTKEGVSSHAAAATGVEVISQQLITQTGATMTQPSPTNAATNGNKIQTQHSEATQQLKGALTDQAASGSGTLLKGATSSLDDAHTKTQQSNMPSEQFSCRTFDRMHHEIVQLQDKIRGLEAQMVSSPSATQTQDGRKEIVFPRDPTAQAGTIESTSTNKLYKHDQKHLNESARQSHLKMTVPKTIMVKPVAHVHQREVSNLTKGDSSVNYASAKHDQNDEKMTNHEAAESRATQRDQESSHREAQDPLSKQKRAKSRSEIEFDLNSINNNDGQKMSSGNLKSAAGTHRGEVAEMTPLQREMSDLMSKSQPDLAKPDAKKKNSRQNSALTVSRKSKSSLSKSPISRSQKSKTRTNRADNKSLNRPSQTTSQSIISTKEIAKINHKKSKTKDRRHSVASSRKQTTSQNGVSFKDETQDQELTETRIRKSFADAPLTEAYQVTGSEFTAPSEIATQRDRQKVSSIAIATVSIMGQEADQDNLVTEDMRSHLITSYEHESSFKSSSIPPNSKKQTFPLRLRRNQNLAPPQAETVSSPSSLMGAAERFLQDSQEALEHTHGASNIDRQSQSDAATPITIQETILKEYEQKIQPSISAGLKAHQHDSSTRNEYQQHQTHKESEQSEISRVCSAVEVTDYLFTKASADNLVAIAGPNTFTNNWTNQTSRFQLGASEKNSSIKALQTGVEPADTRDDDDRQQQNSQSFKRASSHEFRLKDVASQEQADSESAGEQQSDLALDEDNYSPLEQRPFKRVSKQENEAKKATSEMPLQNSRKVQHQSGASLSTGKTAERTRVAFLEQRNRHLELELKRHQIHLKKSDELHQKYKCLKIDYKQLLQSFERSEEIRREQKELINEQRLQLKNLKTKVSKLEGKSEEMQIEIESLKAAHTNMQLSQLNPIQHHSQEIRVSHSRNSATQQVSSYQNTQAFASGGDTSDLKGQQHLRSQSGSELSQGSAQQQLARSQLQNTGPYLNQSYGQPTQHYIGCGTGTGLMSSGNPVPLSTQDQSMILPSYAALSTGGMLDLPGNPGSDLLMMPQTTTQAQGYSDFYDLTTPAALMMSTDNKGLPKSTKSRRHHDRSLSQAEAFVDQDMSVVHKQGRSSGRHKSHRKSNKKHKKSSHRHDRSGSSKHRGNRSRSASNCSSTRRRKSSRSLLQSQSQMQQHQTVNPSAAVRTSGALSLNQSYQHQSLKQSGSLRPPRSVKQLKTGAGGSSKRRRSQSRKKTKKDANKDQGYILNIQTAQSDVIKGVHKFHQSSRTSLEMHQQALRQTGAESASSLHGATSHSRKSRKSKKGNQV